MKFFLIFSLVAVCFFACSSEIETSKENNEKKVFPPDSLMGDYQGKLETEAGAQTLTAQVIAYRDGQYRINLMEKFDSRDPLLAELEGRKERNKIVVNGSDRGRSWKGTIQDKTFIGFLAGDQTGSFILKKTVRHSPLLGRTPPAGALVLFDGTGLTEWEHQRDALGYLNISRHLGTVPHSSVYLKTAVWSEQELPAMLELGSNDAIKAWLNQELIVSHNISRGAQPGQEKSAIRLKKGWNTLLLCITNDGGGSGAFARITNEKSNPLTSLLEKTGPAGEDKSDKNLKANAGFLTLWEVSPPFIKEGMEAADLFNIAFAPENENKGQFEWRLIDFSTADYSPRWQIVDGAMEVLPGSGSLMTKKKFSDYQLHLEFRSPFMPNATGQARGNSGVYNQGRYEVQVLDSYGLSGEDNECGGIYKVAAPLVNMCAPPGQWQSYEIDFQAARFDREGKKLSDASLTVIHNGIPIHDDLKIAVATGGAAGQELKNSGPLMLQDHGDLVQYRNIWLLETSE